MIGADCTFFLRGLARWSMPILVLVMAATSLTGHLTGGPLAVMARAVKVFYRRRHSGLDVEGGLPFGRRCWRCGG
jgi:hypothetical protein